MAAALKLDLETDELFARADRAIAESQRLGRATSDGLRAAHDLLGRMNSSLALILEAETEAQVGVTPALVGSPGAGPAAA